MTIFINPSPATTTYASRLQRVKSPGGIEAWLLEDHTLPVLWTSFCFRSGAAFDPEGKPGAAALLGSMLTESVGDLDAGGFQRRLDEKAIHLSFGAGRDALHGSMTTLTQNVDESFGMAVSDPVFQQRDFERTHARAAAYLRMGMARPDKVARHVFDAIAFAGHPFSRPASGHYETIGSVELSDVVALHSRMIARQNLEIVAVGALGADAFAAALDRAFSRLPVSAEASVLPAPFLGLGEEVLTHLDSPQSTMFFGRPGISVDDPDFMAAKIVNHCLGGRTFTSRLFTELREKRGLCYSIGTSLDASRNVSRLIGSTSTRSDRLYEALDVIRSQFAHLVSNKISAEEVEMAKSYLTGSFALQLNTSSAIAQTLLSTKVEGLQPDFIDERNARIASVTRDAVADAVDRLIGDGALLVSIAGNPTTH
ncbi:insulinase family protein [Rhizobium laguerreae]|uniref:Insulinase family protein n=1 Tax=Rhizobium laguerreae TaxID=1076926 RepID=A0AB35FPU6_9HYPH|nr:pitrilysin family protein [Rhizobium laguerreae]MBY3068540.1 insulinase family protein [Rhizobium laguerreae]